MECRKCGEEMEQHPALTVACGLCGARVGAWCTRDGEMSDLHAPRLHEAYEDERNRCPVNHYHVLPLPVIRRKKTLVIAGGKASRVADDNGEGRPMRKKRRT